MWEIFSCLINCASEASFRSWITVLSFPAHCQAFPALRTAVSLLSSSLLLSHTLLSPLQFCSLLDYLSSSLFCILRAQSSFPGSKCSQSSSRQAFPALQHRQCGCECPVCLPRKSFSFIHFYIFLLPLGHCDFNDLFPDVFLLKWYICGFCQDIFQALPLLSCTSSLRTPALCSPPSQLSCPDIQFAP